MGKTKEALEFFDRSLAILSAINDEFDRANALNAAGQVYLKLNENQKALDRLEESLKLRLALKDQSGEAETRYTIARAERQRNNLPAAISQMQTVLPIVENLRGKVLSKNLRASYVASVQQYFKFYIDLLMQMSRNQQQSAAEYDVLALQVNETARARSLLDLLVESQTDIRQGVDPKLLERERLVRELINSKLQRQSKLLTGRHTEKQLSEIARDINAAQIEHEQLEARIRQSSPRYAALAQAKPVTLETIQKELLDKDTILLEYSLGEERSFLWTVTPDSFKSYELPKQAEIEASAREFYELLTARNDEKQIAVPDDKSARAARSDQKIGEAK
jgi:tetratricopeptide (TPR) repeat protein